MKADASGWLTGLAGGAAPGPAGAPGSRPADTAEPAPAFDRLLRRASPPARGERAATAEARERDTAAAPRERTSQSSAPSSRADTRDTRTGASRRADKSSASETPVDDASAGTEREPARASGEDDRDTAAPWPPMGLILPAIPPPVDAVDAAPVAAPATDALLTGAPTLPPLPASGLRLSGNAASAWTGDITPGDAALPAGTTVAATIAPASGEAAATSARTTGEPSATPSTLPSPAAAIALPDIAATGESLPPPPALGFAAFKELAGDASGNDADAPAPTSAALFGAPPPVSDHGLARTATVNPLTAMTPDLRGDRFGDTLGTQMTWMAEQKIGHAHIRVSPGDLGAIEVSLRLDGDRVHADFSSAQPEVRQALQDSLPRLREMLGQQGFQLAQADVGHRQQSPSQSSTPAQSAAGGRSDGGAGESGQGVVTTTVRTLRGLLDAYA